MTASNVPAAGGFGRMGRYLLVGSDRVFRIPVGILVSGLASRALGVEDFGLYTSVLVLLAVVTPLASFGLESLGIAMASQSRDAAIYLRSLVSFRLFTGVGAALLFLAAALIYFSAVMDRVAVLALAAVGSVLLMRVYELGENLLFAQERLAMLALVRISAFLAADTAIVVVLLNSASLSLLLALSAAESVLLFALYVAVFRRDIAEAIRLWGLGSGTARRLDSLSIGISHLASGLLVLLLLNTDKLLVFRFMGQAESGSTTVPLGYRGCPVFHPNGHRHDTCGHLCQYGARRATAARLPRCVAHGDVGVRRCGRRIGRPCALHHATGVR